MKKVITIIFCLLFSSFIFSQKVVDDQVGSWWNYGLKMKFSEKWSSSHLYSWRRADFIQNWQQSLLRTGVNYKVSEKFIITPGFDWLVNFPYGNQPIQTQFMEFRPFEQFQLKGEIGRFSFVHRYRLEQRFLQNVSLDSANNRVVNGAKFRNRIRYRFTMTIPINHQQMEKNTLFIKMFDEAFVNVGKGIQQNVFDQNWFNMSLGWMFNKNLKISLGYQNQYVIKGDGMHIERNHLLQFAIQHNISFNH